MRRDYDVVYRLPCWDELTYLLNLDWPFFQVPVSSGALSEASAILEDSILPIRYDLDEVDFHMLVQRHEGVSRESGSLKLRRGIGTGAIRSACPARRRPLGDKQSINQLHAFASRTKQHMSSAKLSRATIINGNKRMQQHQLDHS
jgi:hypothetical protein